MEQGADLGFYKGWCPVHLTGAPEVKHRGVGFLNIKMVSFYAFPVIFIDTVLFKKGTLIKRAGCPDTLNTPPGSAPDWGAVLASMHYINGLSSYLLTVGLCG